jgi:hypothetical protein
MISVVAYVASLTPGAQESSNVEPTGQTSAKLELDGKGLKGMK